MMVPPLCSDNAMKITNSTFSFPKPRKELYLVPMLSTEGVHAFFTDFGVYTGATTREELNPFQFLKM